MIISFCIQKGGDGKSTGTIIFSQYLSLIKGYKVLTVDFDSQSNTTDVLLPEIEEVLSLKNVIMDGSPLSTVIRHTNIDGLDIIPANISLAKLERYLIADVDSQYKLRDIIEDNGLDKTYDFILVDTPPSLGILTLNAMVASDFIIIPVRCKKFSTQGVQDLEESIAAIKKNSNKELDVLGAFINQFDQRTLVSKGMEAAIANHFGDKLFRTRVRLNTRIEESMVEQQPIFFYDPKSAGAQDFATLGEEILERIKSRVLIAEPSGVLR